MMQQHKEEGLCQWFTPPGVIEPFLEWADLGDLPVLEPAAGEGALIPDRDGVLAFEIDPERVSELQYWRPKATVVCGNFLQAEPVPFDGVSIQNPPYADDGEGAFIRQSLLWVPRTCALVRGAALHGKERFWSCWRYVRPTRIAVLVHRPQFLGPYGSKSKYGPQCEFVAVECVMRDVPLERPEDAQDDVQIEWVSWR